MWEKSEKEKQLIIKMLIYLLMDHAKLAFILGRENDRQGTSFVTAYLSAIVHRNLHSAIWWWDKNNLKRIVIKTKKVPEK